MKPKKKLHRSVAAPRSLGDHDLAAVSGGSASHSELTVTKVVDKASPSLYRACCTGRHIDEATLVI